MPRHRLPRAARLLEKGIRPAAFDLGAGAGAVRVALRPDWAGLLGGLAGVGPAWRITRNLRASLGLRDDRGYPRLHLSPHGLLAVDAAGTLSAAFGAWRRAWAVEGIPAACGHRLFAAEFEDARGEVFHKVCLGGEARPRRFAAWARAHQADRAEEAEAVGAFLGGDTPGAGPRPGERPAPGALHLPGHLLRETLLAAAEGGIAFRATVHTAGLRQTGEIRVLDAAEGGGWLRLRGEGTALFVEAEPPGGFLRVEPRPVEGEPGWRVSLVEPDGRARLELGAGPDNREPWARLVSDRLLRPGLA